MPLLVQKFGGTSVATADKILAAARRAIRAHQRGDRVLVVVSARGHTTDELVELAKEISERPPAREMDMLLSTGEQVSVALMAMAIQALGVPAISFTGAQIGIVTDSFHTKARIRNISTERMVQALDEGKIVIVAGFQGVDEHYNITTLGRGGSDTTAVALAAVLGADACEIYTDVDGIYTTDPRIVPEARKVDRISYDEMLELASLGAGVMHSRSIEFAKKYAVPIHVRSSFTDTPGTWIISEVEARRLGTSVTGAALARDEALITVRAVPDRPGVVHTLFRRIGEANVVVDMIVQNVSTGGATDVSFTVSAADLAETLRVAESAAREIGAAEVLHDPTNAKVSVVGLGMRTHTGVATGMFDALANAGFNIRMITTSEIKISILVDRGAAIPALRAVHKAFQLDQMPLDARAEFVPKQLSRPPVASAEGNHGHGIVVAGMEDLVISGVELDESQSRITVLDVPDLPGYAAKLFREIARADVFVDMIVQSAASSENTHLSFTVPRSQAQRAAEAAGRAGPNGVVVEDKIAKLSVLGVGVRTHTGAATRHVRGFSRARDQHRPHQHQRGADQRRDRLRAWSRRACRAAGGVLASRRPRIADPSLIPRLASIARRHVPGACPVEITEPSIPTHVRAPYWAYPIAFAVMILLGHLFGGWLDVDDDLGPGSVDHQVSEWVVAHRHTWPNLTRFALLATQFGNPQVATTTILAIAATFALLRFLGIGRVRKGEALFWLAIAGSGWLLSNALKLWFRRVRPPLPGRLVLETSFSFPSGHGTFAGVFFLLMTMVIVRESTGLPRRFRPLLVVAGLLLMLSVAASRVWLGVALRLGRGRRLRAGRILGGAGGPDPLRVVALGRKACFAAELTPSCELSTVPATLARSRPPTDEATSTMNPYREAFYSRQAEWHGYTSTEFAEAKHRSRIKYYDWYTKDWLPADRQAAILDIGCGSGQFLYYLRSKGYENAQGIDLDRDQVEVARGLGLQATCEQAIAFMEAREGPLDVVVMLDIIEHFTREELFPLLNAVAAKLAPGGRLIASVPNADSPAASRAIYADITHEIAFTVTSLAELFFCHGLKVVALRDPWPAPVSPLRTAYRAVSRVARGLESVRLRLLGMDSPKIWSSVVWVMVEKPASTAPGAARPDVIAYS